VQCLTLSMIPEEGPLSAHRHINREGDSGLAGHSGLAETAAAALEPKMGRDVGPRHLQIGHALRFVVAGFAHCPCGAPLDAFPAAPLREKKAVCTVIAVRPGSGRDLEPGHDRTASHRLAHWRDETVAQAEGPQA
jgi:hypothetical protein